MIIKALNLMLTPNLILMLTSALILTLTLTPTLILTLTLTSSLAQMLTPTLTLTHINADHNTDCTPAPGCSSTLGFPSELQPGLSSPSKAVPSPVCPQPS